MQAARPATGEDGMWTGKYLTANGMGPAFLLAEPAFSQNSPVSLRFDGAQLPPSTSISCRNPTNQQKADANGFTVTFNWSCETGTHHPDGDGLRLFAMGVLFKPGLREEIP